MRSRSPCCGWFRFVPAVSSILDYLRAIPLFVTAFAWAVYYQYVLAR